MSRCSNKLSLLVKSEHKLLLQKQSLIDKRKMEIGGLAEHHHLLTLPDEILFAAFAEIADAFQSNDERIQMWKNKSALFFQAKKRNKPTTQKNRNSLAPTSTSAQTYESVRT